MIVPDYVTCCLQKFTAFMHLPNSFMKQILRIGLWHPWKDTINAPAVIFPTFPRVPEFNELT